MAKKSAGAQVVQRVYIGPSISGSNLRSGMILRGTDEEIESFMAPMVEQYPEAGRLLTDVENLADAQKKVRQKGNILNKYYMDVAAKAAAAKRGGGIHA